MIKNKSTARPGEKKRFEAEKVIVARMGKRVVATYDNDQYYVKDGMLLLKKSNNVHLKYITGILNSKIINYYYKNYFITIDVLKNALLELPIVINNKLEESVIRLVENIISLNKKLQGTSNKDDREKIEREIKKVDNEIDSLVYKIYGLTEEEIKIVEESLK